MKKFIIGILEIYVFIGIALFIIGAVTLSSTFNSAIILLLIAFVPLIFGIIIIQIDNNELLHQINNNIKKGLSEEKKCPDTKNKSTDVVS